MGAYLSAKPIEWQDGDYVRALGSGQVLRWNARKGLFDAPIGSIGREAVEEFLRRGTYQRVKVVPYDD